MDRKAIVLAIENVRQKTPQWCWLAVAEQVIRYKQGDSPSQDDLMAWVASHGGDLAERGGTLDEIREMVKAWGEASSVVMRPTNAENLYDDWLGKGSPVILEVDSGPDDRGHVVILKGLVWASDQPLFIINDPMLNDGYALALTWRQLGLTWKRAVAVL